MTGAANVLDLPVAIGRAEVLAFLGYTEGRAPADRIARLLDDVLPEARRLARARGAFLEIDVARAAEIGLRPIDARGLAVGVCTAGPGIEARARELSARGDSTLALLFDAAGSAAAEEAADRMGAVVGGDPEPAGAAQIPAQVTCRLSPGYGGWPIEAQRALFALVPHADVGVDLLPSLMMSPCKSISFAMWLGAVGRPARGLAGCARCGLAHCRYRRAPMTAEEEP